MTVLDKPVRPGAPAEPAPPPPARRRTAAWLLTAALVAGLLLLVPVAAGTGAYPIPVGDVLGSLLHKSGLGGTELDRVAESVLWNVRFPRIVLALLVGASLSCAGALMQGVFGNPLAEPGVIGVSSGAAVGAVGAIAFGLNFLGNWTVSVFAFVSGLVTVLVVMRDVPLGRPYGGRHADPHGHRGNASRGGADRAVPVLRGHGGGQPDHLLATGLARPGDLAEGARGTALRGARTRARPAVRPPPRPPSRSANARPGTLGVDVERLRVVLVLVIALLTARP